jgi:hypothetical protein
MQEGLIDCILHSLHSTVPLVPTQACAPTKSLIETLQKRENEWEEDNVQEYAGR